MNRRTMTVGAALAAFWPGWCVQAQTWPDKPVRLVLSQPPGSGPDAVARLIAERLSKVFRKNLRRKLRASESGAPITMEVLEDATALRSALAPSAPPE